MRRSPATFAALVFTTAASITSGLPSAEAADDLCLGLPYIGVDWEPVQPLLTDVSRIPIEVANFDREIVCDGMVVTVQRPDGSKVVSVPLPEKGGNGFRQIVTRRGYLSEPLATAAGDWVMTKVTHGANELAVNVPFRAVRATLVSLDQPARTSGTAKTTITGLVRRYTSTGALAPAAGATVRLLQTNDLPVATARTDSTGRYRVSVLLTRNTTLRATTAASGIYIATDSEYKTAHKLLAMSYLTAAKTATVFNWWKVTGTAFPGKLWTALEYWNGTAWAPTYSYGYVAANGSYARYWKPDRVGTFRLRVTVSGPGLDNSPWSRETTVTVRQLPQAPTYLTGTIAPTAGPPIKHGTTMSTFGFLKYRRANGSLGPVGNQIVEVLTKRPTDTAWSRVTAMRTTVSGYFYNNWTVYYQAGETFTAIIRYRTALPQAASSTSKTFGPFTVQP